MKKTIRNLIIHLLIAVLLISPAVAADPGTGKAVYKNTTVIADGFSYTNEISYNSAGKRTEKYYTELSPDSDIYPIVMACDTIYGGMTQKAVIKYAESLGYNVISAINTDFFDTSSGIPLGLVIENGEYRSSPENLNALYFTENGAAIAEKVDIKITLTNNGKADDFSNQSKTTNLTHFNKLRNDYGGLYLFSSAFSTVSTRTSTDGWSIRFKIVEGVMTVSGEMKLEVVEKYVGSDAQPIGDDFLILTADTGSALTSEFEKFSVGDSVTLKTECSHPELSDAIWSTGCGDVLVNNGQITDTALWDSAIFGSHPRTAVGIKPNGEIVSYVVDGRTSGHSSGAKLSEIANDMLALGCGYVVNMDGGGSSAISLRKPGSNTCSVINRLPDNYSRKCASYILYVTDSVSDGRAKHLFLAEDGIIVLSGSKLDLHALASDSGYKSVTAPSSIRYSSSGLGKIFEDVYIAGKQSGTDTVTLRSDGLSGSGTIHIIESADALRITDAKTGKSPNFTTVSSGDILQLNALFTCNNRQFVMDKSEITYSVTENIGSISEDGLLTVSGLPGQSGTLTVSGAGLSESFEINIKREFLDLRDHWSKPYVETLYEAGIINGISEYEFAPDVNMGRGDIVLMLWRAAGKPEADTDNMRFTDIISSDYYAEAIAWAAEAGIANGMGNNEFRPKDSVSRQDAFTLMYRALNYLGTEEISTDKTALNDFKDVSDVSDYAKDSLAALINLKIVEGFEGCLTPKSRITRSEVSKIISVAFLVNQ